MLQSYQLRRQCKWRLHPGNVCGVTAPKTRSMFGDGQVDSLISQIISVVGEDSNDDLIRSLMIAALDMDAANMERLDLKIAAQSLVEILNATQVFSQDPLRAKCTVFGSARTKPGTPDYELAKDFSARIATKDWMIISGAGPGIMTAAIEGATVENSYGVNIMLPFEQRAAEIIHGDPKLATFKYFFTRKLYFMKESDAFALFPGGFGTLDEAFELLTLIQTGKSYPAPIVLMDHPDSNYWGGWLEFVRNELLGGGNINPHDLDLFLHTSDAQEAADYICNFYSCYHSVRFVGKRLILRLNHDLPDDALAILNTEFSDIVASGEIEKTDTTEPELRDHDHADLPRIGLRFDNRSFARLNQLILRINELSGHGAEPTVRGLVHDIHLQPDPE